MPPPRSFSTRSSAIAIIISDAFPKRRVAGEKSALAFIEEVGFCTGFSAGTRSAVPARGDRGRARTEDPGAYPARLRDRDDLAHQGHAAAAKRLVYYGKVIAGRPSFIARDLLGAFLRLRIEPGGYAKLYRAVMLVALRETGDGCAHEARRGGDRGAEAVGSDMRSRTRRAEFDRAMKELQEKFLALKVDERDDPFSYVWDTMEHRWPDAIAQARKLTRQQAAYSIVGRYFATAGFGSERAITRLLGVDAALVEGASRRLEREGAIARGLRIDGHAGAISLLSKFAP